MAEIFHFMPRAELRAADNLAAFVEGCRDRLTVFGTDLPFQDDVWDITSDVRQRGLNHRTRLWFSNLSSTRQNKSEPMKEPFLSFAKAYIRYMQGHKPSKNIQIRLTALRALEQALLENNDFPRVELTDNGVLNRAAQIIKERYSRIEAYALGGRLQIIAQFLSEYRLVSVPVTWRNPLKRPPPINRIGDEFEERRSRLMPSADALDAVARAFALATEPADVIVASAAALMCASPSRIGEVLTMPVQCEVHQQRRGNEDAYGLRWWPSKGGDPTVKWIIPTMAGVAAEAIDKIRKVTESARRIAAWYEQYPTRLYLSEDLEYLRKKEWITFKEVGAIIGFNGYMWVFMNKVGVDRPGINGRVLFADVEKKIVSNLPDGFPILDHKTGLTFSEGLFVVQRNLFHPKKVTWPCMIVSVNQTQIGDGLGNRITRGVDSIFSRLGLTKADGKQISVNTHQFRHYLNTLAQSGGLSQLDIAKWSGRRDVRQNRAYDHMSAQELLTHVREAVGDNSNMFGPLAQVQKRAPIVREEFARLRVPTAHTTDLGYCIHDFTMLPCQLHRDCIQCVEHICIKGDHVKTERIRQRLEEARLLLAEAEMARQDGLSGANRWEEHHIVSIARLEQLIAILDDPAIPEGTVIQLSTPTMPSAIRQADEERSFLQNVPAVPLPLSAIDLNNGSDRISDMEKEDA